MLPKSVVLLTERNVLYWKNLSFLITANEAREISGEILRLVRQPNITVMLVDNRGAKGAWPADINPIWADLMAKLTPHLNKCATIADTIAVMQINRLSKEAGTLDKIQAFGNTTDALKFIGASSLSCL